MRSPPCLDHAAIACVHPGGGLDIGSLKAVANRYFFSSLGGDLAFQVPVASRKGSAIANAVAYLRGHRIVKLVKQV